MERRIVKTADILGTPDEHYKQVLRERGGRIAHGFYRIRQKMGDFMHLRLVTRTEEDREQIIRYHESLRNPTGMLWPEDDMTEEQKDAWRLIGSSS